MSARYRTDEAEQKVLAFPKETLSRCDRARIGGLHPWRHKTPDFDNEIGHFAAPRRALSISERDMIGLGDYAAEPWPEALRPY